MKKEDATERLSEIYKLIHELRKTRIITEYKCIKFENETDGRETKSIVRSEEQDTVQPIMFQAANELEFLLDVIYKLGVEREHINKEGCKESIKCFCSSMGIEFNEKSF